MSYQDAPLIDWAIFSETRQQLGAEFLRILGYFREDGAASVAAIEDAMRADNAAALVAPAHKLKSEAWQFGADRLGRLAEEIEMHGRTCVETRQSPQTYVDRVVAMRPMLAETLDDIDRETNPLVQKRAGFGRRTG